MGFNGQRVALVARFATIAVLAFGLFSGFASGALYHGLANPKLPGASPSEGLLALEVRWRPSSPLLNDGRDRSFLGQVLGGSELATRVIGSSSARASFRLEGKRIESIRLGLYSGDFFRLLGVSAAIGTLPAAAAFGADAAPRREIVLGHSLWESLGHPPLGAVFEAAGFHSNAEDGPLLRLVGIAPPGFAGPQLKSAQQAWVAWEDAPGVSQPADLALAESKAQTLDFVAVDGLGLSRQELEDRLRHLALASDVWRNRTGAISCEPAPVLDARERQELLATAVALKYGAGLLLLLVVCAFFLDRWLGWSRQRTELSIRRYLGETPLRSVARALALAARDLLIAVVAATAMIAIGFFNYEGLAQLVFRLPASAAPLLGLEWRFVAYVLCSLLGLLLLSLLFTPHLWRWRVRHRGIAANWERSMRSLVLGFGVLLALVAVGLTLGGQRQIDHWTAADLGFSLQGARIFTYHSDDESARTERLLSPTSAMPEMEALADALAGRVGRDDIVFASSSPFGVKQVVQVVPPAQERAALDVPIVTWMNDVSDNYFNRLRIQLLAGRGFDPAVSDEILLNRSMAIQLFASSNPVGAQVELRGAAIEGLAKKYRVAGVVGDAHYLDPRGGPIPMLYRRLQSKSGLSTVVVLGDLGSGLSARLNAGLKQVEPRWELRDYGDARALVGLMLREARVRNVVLVVVALASIPLIALVLLNTGAHVLVEHHREVAIMRALGAKKTRIVLDLMGKRLGTGLLVTALISVVVVPLVVGGVWSELHYSELALITSMSMALMLIYAVLIAIVLAQHIDDRSINAHLKVDG